MTTQIEGGHPNNLIGNDVRVRGLSTSHFKDNNESTAEHNFQ